MRPEVNLPEVVWPETAQSLREEVRAFLSDERDAGSFVPSVDTWLGGFDPTFSRKLGERGWLGMTWPERYGGHERSSLERFVVIEELLAAGAPVAAHWVADRQTGPTLLRFGTEEQRQRYMPAIARGERYFAIGMSEPDSGSDLASVRTRAVPAGDGGFRVSGTKVWTSGAHRCHHMLTLVRSGADSHDRHAGLSQFIIDLDAPGVTVRPIPLMTGEHHFNEVVLDDVHVPESHIVGRIGEGWEQVTSELGFERSGPERFLSTMPLVTEFAMRGPDLDEASTETLGGLAAELWAVRQLSTRVAAALDAGEAPDVEAALIKDVGTRLEQASIEAIRRCVPADEDGVLRELLDRSVMHAPGFTLRGGTNEILRVVVARGLGL